MHMEFVNDIPAFASNVLALMRDRPVIDLTGLKGIYSGSIDLALPRPPATAPGGTESGASEPGSPFQDAVRPLGLTLEARSMPIEMILVDHMEKTPAEN